MRRHSLQDTSPKALGGLHLPLRRVPPAVVVRIRVFGHLPRVPAAE